jgi:hypothetical protein
MKPFVYIASPYTKGDQAINVRFQMTTYIELQKTGLILPYAPLLTHFVHMQEPQPYEFWLEHCLQVIPRMDAVIRLDAVHEHYRQSESSGADREVLCAEEHDVPIFYSLGALLKWVGYHWPRRNEVGG